MSVSARQNMRRLARSKLDKTGSWLRSNLNALSVAPHGGWVASIRDALGMSQADLANRMGLSQSAVAKLEMRERAGSAQMDSLRRAAHAMDCELVVLMVPRQSLQASVDQRRLQLYGKLYDKAAAHMSLEDQSVSPELKQVMLRDAEESIPDSSLWRESGLG
ncbi:putative DNA-binding mobile mystery protein A [Luteibacter sp. OK325]|uniref:helix-turn-helix domain-containing protein n=1 Tax=Luteibacter sp. OK325 TaxID=2135670 RepID=UPI000D342104|nr:helix-turn-helix domain-containing protein [Luteibacter sp. OK325]PTR33512.1 putative DNA-binding mobile mystery protein A [Luteibacter sp. OK325]